MDGLEEHRVGRVRTRRVDALGAGRLDRRSDVRRRPRVPNSPCSPACGFSPHTAIRGAGTNRRSAASVRRITSSTRSCATRSMASRSEQWVLTWVTASEPCSCSAVSIIVTDVDSTALGDELGVPDEARIGQLRRLLVHRHRDDTGDIAVEGGVGRGSHVGPRRGTRRPVELARTMIDGAQEVRVDDAQAAGDRLQRDVGFDDDDRHVEVEQLAARRRIAASPNTTTDPSVRSTSSSAPEHDLGTDSGRHHPS